MNASIIELELPSEPPSARGTWANIRWTPDLKTGESLNVGVLLRTDDGTTHFRLLDRYERVSCLYGDSFAEDTNFLLGVLAASLRRGEDLPSPNLTLSQSKFAAGKSVAQLLDELFDATVTLARDSSVQNVSRERYLNNDAVRGLVFDAIRTRVGIRAESVLRSEATLNVEDSGVHHFLDIPIQGAGRLGTVVAAPASQTTTEVRLARAERDLLVARTAFRTDRLFLYVVRQEPPSKRDSNDTFYDEIAWKLGRLGMKMRSSMSAEETAEDVIEDMGLA